MAQYNFNKPKLNPRESRFVSEYMVDGNHKQAALRAGYSAGNGIYLINRPKIHMAIEYEKQKQSRRIGITADNALREIARVAFSDIRKVFDEQGNLKPLHELDDDVAAAISSVEMVVKYKKDEDGNAQPELVKKIRIWDKNSALEKLGKHFKLWEDKVRVDASVTHKKDPSWDKDDPESIRRAYVEIFGTPPDTPGIGEGSGD